LLIVIAELSTVLTPKTSEIIPNVFEFEEIRTEDKVMATVAKTILVAPQNCYSEGRSFVRMTILGIVGMLKSIIYRFLSNSVFLKNKQPLSF